MNHKQGNNHYRKVAVAFLLCSNTSQEKKIVMRKTHYPQPKITVPSQYAWIYSKTKFTSFLSLHTGTVHITEMIAKRLTEWMKLVGAWLTLPMTCTSHTEKNPQYSDTRYIGKKTKLAAHLPEMWTIQKGDLCVNFTINVWEEGKITSTPKFYCSSIK